MLLEERPGLGMAVAHLGDVRTRVFVFYCVALEVALVAEEAHAVVRSQFEGNPVGGGELVVVRFGALTDQSFIGFDRAQHGRQLAGQFRAQQAEVDLQQRQQMLAEPGLVGREDVGGEGDHAG